MIWWTDATENYDTDEVSDTVDSVTVVSDMDKSLPEHSFVSNTIIGKTGKLKGIKRTTWTLFTGPYSFKRSKVYKDNAYFYCNDFNKYKKICSAIAKYESTCYCFLPNKSRISYDTMFRMLKGALSRRGLWLSAEFFMSDFGINICESFMRIFEDIQVWGCIFHFGKAIISNVHTKESNQIF